MHPTDGRAPLGLPDEYADLAWVDPQGPGCTTSYGGSSYWYCYENFSCDGSGYNNVSCSLDTTAGQWGCSCQVRGGKSTTATIPDSLVDVNDQYDACRLAGAVCLTELPTTAEDCDTWETSSKYGCDRQQSCATVHQSTYGEIAKGETTGVGCNADSVEGDTACWCYSSYSSFSVSVSADDSCGIAMDVCSGGLDQGSSAAAQCTRQSRQFGDDFCRSNSSCTQSATADGYSVELHRYLDVDCQVSAPGSWDCACSSDGQPYGASQPFLAATPEEACDLSAATCAEAMGEYNGL